MLSLVARRSAGPGLPVAAVGLCLSLLCAGLAHAQTAAPAGPVRLIAGFAAGGSSDIVARLVAQRLQTTRGWTVVVENKPGAGGRTAAQEVARAKPDGTTLFIANIVNAVLIPLTFSDANYHPQKDFTPIARAADFQIAFATGPMTGPGAGAKTLAELAAWLRANADKAVYGVPGAGSIPHLYAIDLAKREKIDLRMLQLRGGGPVATELLAANIPLGVAGTADFAELHRDGKIRIVAVSGERRAPGFDDVPTFKEQGLDGFEANGWLAFFAPPAMPADLQKALGDAVVEALVSPEIAAQMTKLGFLSTAAGPDALAAQVARDIAKWTPLIDASGVKK